MFAMPETISWFISLALLISIVMNVQKLVIIDLPVLIAHLEIREPLLNSEYEVNIRERT